MIFQVTLGCSFNKCSFCNMYRSKEYYERPMDELKSEIDVASKYYSDTRRVFLADGDAINAPTSKLVEILEYLKQKFPHLERVSCYAMPSNILRKSDKDLELLRSAGLGMFYVGIESGNDVVLRKVTKGATQRTIIAACSKARSHGLILSCMIILGLGGKKYTTEHISDTAKILNEIAPDYVGALTLHLEDGIRQEFLEKYGEQFTPLDDVEVLDEIERLLLQTRPNSPIIFRANHASNVYSVGGTLPADSTRLVAQIQDLKSRPELWKPKEIRRF